MGIHEDLSDGGVVFIIESWLLCITTSVRLVSSVEVSTTPLSTHASLALLVCSYVCMHVFLFLPTFKKLLLQPHGSKVMIIERAKRAHSPFMSIEISDIYLFA